MGVSDVFKKSFLDGFYNGTADIKQILAVMAFTSLIAIYIFFIYRLITKKTFYNKNFSISLVAMALITAAIIITIQYSIIVSLGMVGALSIVRFRTAIKDPMDLVFLFWAISVGIICGAEMAEVAMVLSIAVTILVLILDKVPMVKAPKILVVNGKSTVSRELLNNTISKFASYYTEKSCRYNNDNINLIYELRIKDTNALVDDVRKIDGITSISVLENNGEVTC